jgi:ferredoxin
MSIRQASATATDVLVVDWSRCVGHGVCAAALGEQVSLDRWGYPHGVSTAGVPVDPDLRRAAKMAVRTCPAVALKLAKRG